MVGKTSGQNNRTIDRTDRLERRNFPRRPGKTVTTVGALLRNQKAGLGELLQHLRKDRQRNVIRLRNILRARTPAVRRDRKVAERDQTVVGFLGELEHDASNC